jgi:acetyltransferase-like isoleucine patch superfamily enzyme
MLRPGDRESDRDAVAQVGGGLSADDGVIVGYPAERRPGSGLFLGDDARLRSGTVIYAGSTIGHRLQTGHHVIIREDNRLGDDVAVWSNSVVDYGCIIGDRVKIHSNCYVAQFTQIEDDAFLAPGVTIANDLIPGSAASADAMQGPLIRRGAQIGVNVTIVPYVTIGVDSIIGAGSVVTKDVPDGVLAYGNPAVPVRSVRDLGDIDARVREARSRRARLAASNDGATAGPPTEGTLVHGRS